MSKKQDNSNHSVFKPKTVAVLVDLSFFINRYRSLKRLRDMTSEDFAKRLKDYVFESVQRGGDYIYRVYVYDCEPLNKNVSMPPLLINGSKSKNLGKTHTFRFRSELLEHLRKQPYFAIRLGEFDDSSPQWKLKEYDKFKQLLQGKIDVNQLTDDDFVLDIRQKGVDIKIGLDIATLSNKKLVEKIILITADSDFVPAIKHARREGVVIQLDPMQLPNSQIKKGYWNISIFSHLYSQIKDKIKKNNFIYAQNNSPQNTHNKS